MLEVINCLELPNSQHMIKHCIFYIIGVLSPLMVIQTASEVDHHTKLPLLKQRAAKIGSMAACGKSGNVKGSGAHQFKFVVVDAAGRQRDQFWS